MKKVALAFVILGSLVCMQAFATPTIRGQFKAKYPNVATVTCKMCHETPPKLNPYGLDVQKSALNFESIELLDSDGDGVNNITEINAGTLPGDKTSTPPHEAEDFE